MRSSVSWRHWGWGAWFRPIRFQTALPMHFPAALITGLAVTVLTMAVVFGGIGRISEAASRLVPFSACLYMFLCGIVIFSRYDKVPGVFSEIVRRHLTLRAPPEGQQGTECQKRCATVWQEGYSPMKPDWEAWRCCTARPGRQRPKNRECGLYLKCFSIQSSAAH